jgi:hypothetical protein
MQPQSENRPIRRRRWFRANARTTVMEEAFITALRIWVQRHADTETITIPTGAEVMHSELARVICALLAARRAP